MTRILSCHACGTQTGISYPISRSTSSGPPLIGLTSLASACRVILIAIVASQLSGTILLHLAIFRRRSYWPLGSGLIIYNNIFLMGFLNYLLGIGLAMIAASAWLSRAPLSPKKPDHLSCIFFVFTFLLSPCGGIILPSSYQRGLIRMYTAGWPHACEPSKASSAFDPTNTIYGISFPAIESSNFGRNDYRNQVVVGSA